ncbi:MAG: hypothetical protein HKP61_09090 [Dactylosporangium sp.]|nr:hypothetical protein [Dactylosporangium sp.]NNJ61086.1 hypothetical protein [Dactylosporangium sp.]
MSTTDVTDNADATSAVREQRPETTSGSSDEVPETAPAADDGTDPWRAFAPLTPKRPGWIVRGADRCLDALVRFVSHEWTLAGAATLLLAGAMTWPALRHPQRTVPVAVPDAAADAWRLAWAGHSLTTDPTTFFSANVFAAEGGVLPAAGRLLGLAPFGMIGTGFGSAVLRYNLIFVLAFALAAFGGYALVRQLGARRLASTVAAVAFAYAPWRLGQAGQLDALAVGGVPLALAMLARGHGWSLRSGRRPERRHAGWVLLGWLVAAWQISLGVDVGLPFAYLLLAIVFIMLAGWLLRRARPRPRFLVVLAATVGITATAGVTVAMTALATRISSPVGSEVLAEASTPLLGFVTAPAESLLWGGAHASARAALVGAGNAAMLPGFFLLALALAGLVVSVWRPRVRLLLVLGVGFSALLAMGAAAPEQGWVGFRAMGRSVPGWDVLAAPNRLLVWTTLLLCLLAAGAVDGLARRSTLGSERLARIEQVLRLRASAGPGRDRLRGARTRALTRAGLRLLLVLPLVLVIVEGLPRYPAPMVEVPVALRAADLDEATEPLLILPTGSEEDAAIMLWSVGEFPAVVNGTSEDLPESLVRARALAPSFPTADSIDAFQDLGVRTVVVLREPAARAGYVTALGQLDEYLIASYGLTVVRETSDVLVFTLP